jgi:hypothetical protein
VCAATVTAKSQHKSQITHNCFLLTDDSMAWLLDVATHQTTTITTATTSIIMIIMIIMITTRHQQLHQYHSRHYQHQLHHHHHQYHHHVIIHLIILCEYFAGSLSMDLTECVDCTWSLSPLLD